MPDWSDVRGRRSASTPKSQRHSADAERRPSRSIPILIVGPAGFYNEGLRRVLALHGFRTITHVPTLRQTKALPLGKPQLVLVTETDVEADLPATVARLRAESPAARFAVFVDTSSARRVEDAMQIPAHAFLCQTIGADALVGALEVILGDGGVLSISFVAHVTACEPAVENRLPKAASDQRLFLSSREADILRCLTDGISNKLIARQFDIAESTVKIHVKSILRKINVQNRTQAAIWALVHCPHPDVVAASARVDHAAAAY